MRGGSHDTISRYPQEVRACGEDGVLARDRTLLVVGGDHLDRADLGHDLSDATAWGGPGRPTRACGQGSRPRLLAKQHVSLGPVAYAVAPNPEPEQIGRVLDSVPLVRSPFIPHPANIGDANRIDAPPNR